MKYKIEFEGNWYEDTELLKWLAHIDDMVSAIDSAKDFIRNRLKYEDDWTDKEESVLEEIREILSIPGID